MKLFKRIVEILISKLLNVIPKLVKKIRKIVDFCEPKFKLDEHLLQVIDVILGQLPLLPHLNHERLLLSLIELLLLLHIKDQNQLEQIVFSLGGL